MTAPTLFIIIMAIYIADFVWSRYLSWINMVWSKKPVPDILKDIYNAEQYERQQLYFQTNAKFGLLVSLVSFVAMATMLILDGFAWINTMVESMMLSATISSITFFAIIYVANDIIGLPFDIYDIFVIEQRFGFNKTTPKTFVLDKLKGYLLTALIGGLLLWAIITIYDATPNFFWLWAWLVVSIFSLFMATFYSNLIVPLFNKQTPLGEGSLRNKIESFAQTVDFKLTNIYTIDGSKRSTKANAYFTGMFGKKRIVLYDTLIDKLSEDEIVAVLSHEIGHYKHRHTTQSIVISLTSNLLMFILLGIILKSDLFAQALGVSQALFHINIVVFGILYTPISMLLDIFANIMSRRAEYQADNFAKTHGQGQHLISALKRLSSDSLSNLTPHPLRVFIDYSHPTLYQRVLNLTK